MGIDGYLFTYSLPTFGKYTTTGSSNVQEASRGLSEHRRRHDATTVWFMSRLVWPSMSRPCRTAASGDTPLSSSTTIAALRSFWRVAPPDKQGRRGGETGTHQMMRRARP